MDITALSTALSQVQLQEQLGVKLLENAKELTEIEGEAIAEMIEAIPTPGVGEHIDIAL